MRETLLPLLVDPLTRSPLTLEARDLVGDDVVDGSLVATNGKRYPVARGIPRFVDDAQAGQGQVQRSFAYKWSVREGYEHPRVNALNEQSELERYGLTSVDEFRGIFKGLRVLDAGCAAGHHSSIYVTKASAPHEWVGLDISNAIDIARDRLGGIPGTNFVQGDILCLPFADAAFDLVMSRGVMHHTPSTRRAFASLTRALRPGGEFIFFVYRRRGPIREFTDDFIRSIVSSMPPDEAWQRIERLTRLGEALSKVKDEVIITEDIPYLEIKEGRYSVHELIYDHFLKAFFNPQWSIEESNLISFDWYHPVYAYRHTEQEIRQWCAEEHLVITHLDSRWTGFTVRAVKQR